MDQIPHEIACRLDENISVYWRTGRLYVLKVCGWHRIGMLFQYLKDEEDKVECRFLLVDTMLSNCDAKGAWHTLAPSCIQRAAGATDLMLMFHELKLPPRKVMQDEVEGIHNRGQEKVSGLPDSKENPIRDPETGSHIDQGWKGKLRLPGRLG